MKVAVLCLCLISITAAWPVSKSKQHAISASSEEKYDPRDHDSHRSHHRHGNSQSWERLQHARNELASPQQTLYSSEESVDVPVEPRFPDASSKSHEDVDDDDDNDDNDDNDSNDTDESDELVTSFPTDITVTFPPFPFTRGDNAGRGDSVAYRMRAKAAAVKSSKLRKAAKKLLVYDATKEDDSALDADSHQEGLSWEDAVARRSPGKHSSSSSREWADKSQGRDSSELDSKQHNLSVENDSRQKFDSREAGDDSKAGARGDKYQSRESRESQVHVSAEIPDDNSNQTLESAEDARDHHSIENNEVTL